MTEDAEKPFQRRFQRRALLRTAATAGTGAGFFGFLMWYADWTSQNAEAPLKCYYYDEACTARAMPVSDSGEVQHPKDSKPAHFYLEIDYNFFNNTQQQLLNNLKTYLTSRGVNYQLEEGLSRYRYQIPCNDSELATFNMALKDYRHRVATRDQVGKPPILR